MNFQEELIRRVLGYDNRTIRMAGAKLTPQLYIQYLYTTNAQHQMIMRTEVFTNKMRITIQAWDGTYIYMRDIELEE